MASTSRNPGGWPMFFEKKIENILRKITDCQNFFVSLQCKKKSKKNNNLL